MHAALVHIGGAGAAVALVRYCGQHLWDSRLIFQSIRHGEAGWGFEA